MITNSFAYIGATDDVITELVSGLNVNDDASEKTELLDNEDDDTAMEDVFDEATLETVNEVDEDLETIEDAFITDEDIKDNTSEDKTGDTVEELATDVEVWLLLLVFVALLQAKRLQRTTIAEMKAVYFFI